MKKYISRLLLLLIILNLLFKFDYFTIKTSASLYTEDYIYNSPEEVDDDYLVTVNKTENTEVNIEIESQAAVLIEGSTGRLIFEKNKDEKLKPASVTKVMTLLLIFEAIKSKQITLSDEVTVSEHAASMGGSQVFLEPFEIQTVDTMLKCISISSANDASVAMADMIAGSEEEFVARMNIRAKELGMNNTNFINCTGLDEDNHYTSAYDIALMSKELIIKHPEVSNYSTIWMDTFTHKTRKGESEFGLSNTNKLIRSYDGITGLKTGSTSLAKYCLSATAKKNNMDLIAIILASPDPKTRFREAAKLLNYGFANYSIYFDDNKDILIEPIKVRRGNIDYIEGKVEGDFSYLCEKSVIHDDIKKEIIIFEDIKAPINENDLVGEIKYYYNNNEIGTIKIISVNSVNQATYKDYFYKLLNKLFIKNN